MISVIAAEPAARIVVPGMVHQKEPDAGPASLASSHQAKQPASKG